MERAIKNHAITRIGRLVERKAPYVLASLAPHSVTLQRGGLCSFGVTDKG